MLKPRRAKMLRDARERAGLVLDQDGDGVAHPVTPRRPLLVGVDLDQSTDAAPAGTIG